MMTVKSAPYRLRQVPKCQRVARAGSEIWSARASRAQLRAHAELLELPLISSPSPTLGNRVPHAFEEAYINWSFEVFRVGAEYGTRGARAPS